VAKAHLLQPLHSPAKTAISAQLLLLKAEAVEKYPQQVGELTLEMVVVTVAQAALLHAM
jgi:hypothetical protein